ncbi:hypothetical protein AGABI1DRAFT_95690 [Agaricus bisporus var. burnettii JB137-S8]|uniref:Uncharacterized protein n=1 Tax=Agaricus bisporus var. burnettii (strain JB137-S8 / ATCC MYA-4627 / FGSC 10392) TaxID=597362 RepID=K5WGH7_AGABU|nr:uncharacterized protein AGABI1DRAFT_95690 [Agaricus bisporus var. burnettii JB137-S8]EKM74376.1 hypothetical protein AGABI1DRAFT_95690 [Agaricus bisporus var. burnettii JB137-S8]
MGDADLTGLPEEVRAAVEGFAVALEAAKVLRQQANSALKSRNVARLAKESYKGSDASVVKGLATEASATNKTYTTNLDKLKALKTAARQARYEAEQMLIAHHISSVELGSIALDAALRTKTIEASAAVESVHFIEQEYAELSAGQGAVPTGGSSPLSSAPESPGCSGSHEELGLLPEPPSHTQLGMAAPMDVDHTDSAGVGPHAETDNAHGNHSTPHLSAAAPLVGAEQSASNAASVEPQFPVGADYPSMSTFSRKDLPTPYPIASWPTFMPGGFPHLGSLNEGNMTYALGNQLGLNAFNFPTGNQAYLDGPKSGDYAKGGISFTAALHGTELPQDDSSWIGRDLGKPSHLPGLACDISAAETAPSQSSDPSHQLHLESVGSSSIQIDDLPAKTKAKSRAKGKKKEPTLAALREATSDSNDPGYSAPEPSLFGVLPKPSDPPYNPPPSRHDTAGFDPLDIDLITYWKCDRPDPAYESTNKKDSLLFTALSEIMKGKYANDARNDAEHFTRNHNSSPMTAGNRDMIRNEAGLLPGVMLHSHRAFLHLHTTNARNLLCTYHKFSKKADNLHVSDTAPSSIRKGQYVTGVPHPRNIATKQSDPIADRVPGHFHCGCPEDVVFMEAILRKITHVTSVQNGATETWQSMFMDPRTRIFTMTAFMDWTGLQPSDFLKVAPDGRFRDDPYAELLDRQISVLQQRRQALNSHTRLRPSNQIPNKEGGDQSPTCESSRAKAPPRKRQKADHYKELDSPDCGSPDEDIFNCSEDENYAAVNSIEIIRKAKSAEERHQLHRTSGGKTGSVEPGQLRLRKRCTGYAELVSAENRDIGSTGPGDPGCIEPIYESVAIGKAYNKNGKGESLVSSHHLHQQYTGSAGPGITERGILVVQNRYY